MCQNGVGEIKDDVMGSDRLLQNSLMIEDGWLAPSFIENQDLLTTDTVGDLYVLVLI